MCPCGKAVESKTHIVGECEIYKEDLDVLEEMRKMDECGMETFGTLDSSEKAIAILGDRWWPQAVKQEGDKISKKNPCNIWKKRNERPNVGCGMERFGALDSSDKTIAILGDRWWPQAAKQDGDKMS